MSILYIKGYFKKSNLIFNSNKLLFPENLNLVTQISLYFKINFNLA